MKLRLELKIASGQVDLNIMQLFSYIHMHAYTCEYLVNCLDRHVAAHPDRVAIIWEKDEPGKEERVTYK